MITPVLPLLPCRRERGTTRAMISHDVLISSSTVVCTRTAEFHSWPDSCDGRDDFFSQRGSVGAKERERETETRQGLYVDKQFEFKLKNSLWCFFFSSHRVPRTSWHIPRTFQPQIPNVTPPDTSKKAAPPHWAQIEACFAPSRRFSIDKDLFIPVPGVICSWERIACSWNVLESQQTTEVAWF